MNLYVVYPRCGDWGCHVFEETRNKAKSRMVGYFDNEMEYIDFSVSLIKKNTGGNPEICDVDCERLELLGVRYIDEEEAQP